MSFIPITDGVPELPPTEAQIKYAEEIAKLLNIELPKEFTIGAYSEFISKNKFDAASEENPIPDDDPMSPDSWFTPDMYC